VHCLSWTDSRLDLQPTALHAGGRSGYALHASRAHVAHHHAGRAHRSRAPVLWIDASHSLSPFNPSAAIGVYRDQGDFYFGGRWAVQAEDTGDAILFGGSEPRERSMDLALLGGLCGHASLQ